GCGGTQPSGDDAQIDPAGAGGTPSRGGGSLEKIRPPAMTVSVGGVQIPVVQGSYCWTGEGTEVCIDTVGPAELVRETAPTPVSPGATLQLSYQLSPSEVSVSLF